MECIISQPGQRRYQPAQEERHGPQQRGSHSPILTYRIQRKGDAQRRYHAHTEQHQDKHNLEQQERECQFQRQHNQHPHNWQAHSTPGHNSRQILYLHDQTAACHQPQGIEGKTKAILQRRQSEMLLENKRRGGYVGNQRRSRESLQQIHHEVFAVRHYRLIAPEGFPDRYAQPVFLAQ